MRSESKRVGGALALLAAALVWSGLSGGCTTDLRSELDDSCADGSCEPAPPSYLNDDLQGRFTASDEPEVCADVSVVFSRQIPTVTLLVDQSGSMTSHFDGSTRWASVYHALMDGDDGVVSALEGEVRFGLALYTSYNGGPSCPVLTEVAPRMENRKAMDAVFAAASPQDDTPTGEAIEAVVPSLLASGESGPKMILLATDGEPDSCAVPDPQNGQPEALAGARAAHEAGVDVVVLSVGNQLSESHQRAMADAGAGVAGAPIYRPNTRQALIDDFAAIVDGARTCVFDLDGEVVAEYAHEGTVTLNGAELVFGDSDGWRLNTPSEIELLGAACEEVMAGGNDAVDGTFPCHAVVDPLR